MGFDHPSGYATRLLSRRGSEVLRSGWVEAGKRRRSKRSPATFFKGTENGHDKVRCRITNVTSSFHTDTNDLLKACKDELRTGWGAALLGAGAFLLSHFVWKLRPWPLVSTVPLLGLVCSQGF